MKKNKSNRDSFISFQGVIKSGKYKRDAIHDIILDHRRKDVLSAKGKSNTQCCDDVFGAQ